MTSYAQVSRSCTDIFSVPIIRRTPQVPRRRGTLQQDVPQIFALQTLHAGVTNTLLQFAKPAVAAAGLPRAALLRYNPVRFGRA